MIIRRFAEALAKQDWFTVAIEIVIVVIGVFIGIQVANWNDDSKDRIAEKAFLTDLYEDVVTAQRLSNRILGIRYRDLENMKSASLVLLGHVPDRPLTDIECNAISTGHIVGFYSVSLPAYTALLDSDAVGIVRNKSLMRALAELAQRREVLDTIIRSVQLRNYDLLRLYPDAFGIELPNPPPLENLSTQDFDILYTCNAEILKANKDAVSELLWNIDAFDAGIRRVGAQPWFDQIKVIRNLLEETYGFTAHEAAS